MKLEELQKYLLDIYVLYAKVKDIPQVGLDGDIDIFELHTQYLKQLKNWKVIKKLKIMTNKNKQYEKV